RLSITAFGLIDCRLQREDTITQRPPSCQANDEPHQEMISVGLIVKLSRQFFRWGYDVLGLGLLLGR
ncbi:hypothetical protein, partial [Streptomyces sp. BE133]|uniref:hypothetical protein n=1 Tax=Streptomyces sp. BE133 TaxID=3002523 RepID=UPI002E792AE9